MSVDETTEHTSGQHTSAQHTGAQHTTAQHTEDAWGNENARSESTEQCDREVERQLHEQVAEALREHADVTVMAMPSDHGAGEIVLLEGSVDTAEDRALCEEIACGVTGVAKVVNQIRLRGEAR